MTALEAGRGTDARIATEVMGELVEWYMEGPKPILFYAGMRKGDYGIMEHQPVPNYSTDIAAAWQVIEKLVGRVVIDHWNSDGYRVSIYLPSKPPSVEAHADTAPLAICRAALAAME